MKKNKSIDHYKQRPNEKVFKDFQKLDTNRLQKMVEATSEGKGKTIKMTFEIPIEYATLAAWLELRSVQYQGGNNIPMALSDVIETPLNNHDLKCAGSWISATIDHQMMLGAYHDLCTGAHPYLYDRPSKKTYQKAQGDDDLPF